MHQRQDASPLRSHEAKVWDKLEGCEESALTVEGKGSSFYDFIKRWSKQEVGGFFHDIVCLLHEKSIVNYHLVLHNQSRDEADWSEDSDGSDNGRDRGRRRITPERKLEESDGNRHKSRKAAHVCDRRREPDYSANERHYRRQQRDKSRQRSRSPRRRASWKIVIYHGGDARADFSGPIAASRCMSCDLRTSMKMGLTGNGVGGLSAYESLIYEDHVMRYWNDAKGRAMLVVTPKRHVRDLRELNEEELYQLFAGAMQVVDDMYIDNGDIRDLILNAGLDQNHEHLHLKIRIFRRAFERARRRWSPRRNQVVDRLRDYADSQHC